MRLDKYLKVSRLIKRRTVANEACDNGLVTVNGKPARASYEVKVGDEISLRFGVRTVTVEVQDGTLLGFGSANPCSEDPYDGTVCPTYQGTVMAVFRGSGHARFTAEGLPPLELDF